MHHLHFNHWALLVSAVILWILGATWYSPALFSKPWMALVGHEKGNPKAAVAGMIVSFIGNLILSLVLAHFVEWSGADSFGWGALIGFISWMGFIAAPLAGQSIFEGRPFKLYAINVGYWLVGLPICGGLLAVWR